MLCHFDKLFFPNHQLHQPQNSFQRLLFSLYQCCMPQYIFLVIKHSTHTCMNPKYWSVYECFVAAQIHFRKFTSWGFECSFKLRIFFLFLFIVWFACSLAWMIYYPWNNEEQKICYLGNYYTFCILGYDCLCLLDSFLLSRNCVTHCQWTVSGFNILSSSKVHHLASVYCNISCNIHPILWVS